MACPFNTDHPVFFCLPRITPGLPATPAHQGKGSCWCKNAWAQDTKIFFPASAYWPVWPGQLTVLSRKKRRSCTGPFNWGGARCAGENVKQLNRTIPTESLEQQTQTKPQQRRAQPATATRNPPARLPGARAKNQQPKRTQETSKTDPGTP